MPIVQQGSINTTALIVPNLYVVIVPPQNLVLNGVPTNLLGMVGTASWGPVNTAVIVATMADYSRNFGPIRARKYDMGTATAVAVQQGASNFRCVRVSDGTDLAATGTLGTTWLAATALFTGTFGNGITITWGTGSKSGTSSVTISAPGYQPERFDNIAGTGNALAVAAAAAINAGSNVLRGPSQLVTVAAGAGTTAPAVGTSASLTGGTDGVATITAATLVGSDSTRTGMYALRGKGCSVGMLADADDSTQWTTIDGFGLSEGIYMIQVMPAGTSIVSAVSLKATAGLDSYASKIMHGDWLYWNDQVNGVLRLVSPQGFVAGRLANLSPEQSSLNKPIYSVAGSQKAGLPGSNQAQSYSDAELGALFQVGIDVICNPVPGGTYWGVRLGHNSSSNAAQSGDNYTRMTNYIAATINAGMGLYIGQVINAALFRRIKATLSSFLLNMLGQGLLGSTDGSLPFNVICDLTDNPNSRTSLGYVQADMQVQYQPINEKFIVNMEGGATVQIQRTTTPSGQIAA